MPIQLTEDEKTFLLRLARAAITAAVAGQLPPPVDKSQITPALAENGASFVTLTIDGHLRGCIGSLEAFQPLIKDVQTRAVQAALEDNRFYPLTLAELSTVKIEISRLTPSVPLSYADPLELPRLIRPGVDGVVLSDGWRRATYLPQVWEQLPNPTDFLSSLCQKMGAPRSLWRERLLDVETYQVEEFCETDPRD